jgi:hypothetical protein
MRGRLSSWETTASVRVSRIRNLTVYESHRILRAADLTHFFDRNSALTPFLHGMLRTHRGVFAAKLDKGPISPLPHPTDPFLESIGSRRESYHQLVRRLDHILPLSPDGRAPNFRPYRPARGGTGTQARSLRPTFSRTSERTRRLPHRRHTIRRRTCPTTASGPNRPTRSSTSTCARCQQFPHSNASAPRSMTWRRVHLSTSRSFKSISTAFRDSLRRVHQPEFHVHVMFASPFWRDVTLAMSFR